MALARVPDEWLKKQRKIANQIGISLPQSIALTDDLFVQLAKKQKGRRGSVFEITFK